MALRFIDGFETYGPVSTDLSDLQQVVSGRWNSLQQNSGTDSNITIQAGMSSGLSLYFYGVDCHICKVLDNQQTWVMGFWIKFTSFYSSVRHFIEILDGEDEQCEIRIDGSNKTLEVWTDDTYRGESAALSLDTWYFIEFKVVIDTTASGTYELKIDGTTSVSGSAITSATSNNYANSIIFSSQWNNFYIDDVYICDGTAGLNDFIGPCKVNVFYPTSDSTPSNWTPSTGSDHFAVVNDSVRDTATYMSTDTNGHEDMFNFSSSGAGAVLGVQLSIECASAGTEIKEFKAIMTDGANEVTVSKSILGGVDTPQGVLAISEYLPGTSTDWTYTTINSMDFGFEKVS